MGLLSKKAKPIQQNPTRAYEGPPIREAVEYAKTLHTDLIKDYDEDDKKRIAQIISEGIKNKRGLGGISVDIRREFPAINKSLADNLAHTETSIALSHAMVDKISEFGPDYGKKWVAPLGSCEICVNNASMGVISVDKPFPSGHMTTPAHDGCRCAISPARFSRKR